MWIKKDFFYAVLMPAICTVLPLLGPVCLKNNYFQILFSLRVKKDGT